MNERVEQVEEQPARCEVCGDVIHPSHLSYDAWLFNSRQATEYDVGETGMEPNELHTSVISTDYVQVCIKPLCRERIIVAWNIFLSELSK